MLNGAGVILILNLFEKTEKTTQINMMLWRKDWKVYSHVRYRMYILILWHKM